MKRDVDEWWEETHAVVAAHAPELRSDFGMSVSTSSKRYSGLNGEQSRQIAGFDVKREKVRAILAEIRRR